MDDNSPCLIVEVEDETDPVLIEAYLAVYAMHYEDIEHVSARSVKSLLENEDKVALKYLPDSELAAVRQTADVATELLHDGSHGTIALVKVDHARCSLHEAILDQLQKEGVQGLGNEIEAATKLRSLREHYLNEFRQQLDSKYPLPEATDTVRGDENTTPPIVAENNRITSTVNKNKGKAYQAYPTKKIDIKFPTSGGAGESVAPTRSLVHGLGRILSNVSPIFVSSSFISQKMSDMLTVFKTPTVDDSKHVCERLSHTKKRIGELLDESYRAPTRHNVNYIPLTGLHITKEFHDLSRDVFDSSVDMALLGVTASNTIRLTISFISFMVSLGYVALRLHLFIQTLGVLDAVLEFGTAFEMINIGATEVADIAEKINRAGQYVSEISDILEGGRGTESGLAWCRDTLSIKKRGPIYEL